MTNKSERARRRENIAGAIRSIPAVRARLKRTISSTEAEQVLDAVFMPVKTRTKKVADEMI